MHKNRIILFMVFVVLIVGCGDPSLYDFSNTSNGKESKFLNVYDTIKNPWEQKYVAVAENEKGIFLITYKNYNSEDMQKEIDAGTSMPSYRGRPTFNLYGLDHAYMKEDIDASGGLNTFLKEWKLQPLKCVRGWCRSSRFHTYMHMRFPSEERRYGDRMLVRIDASPEARQAYRNALQSEMEKAQKEKHDLLTKQAEKYLAGVLKKLGLPSENVEWSGSVDDNGIPYGTGKLSMIKTLQASIVSVHMLVVELSSVFIEKGKIQHGEGKIQIYRVSYIPMYSKNIRFAGVTELKSEVKKAIEYYNKKERHDAEQMNRYIDAVFKTEDKDVCTSYKEKCLAYCEPKSDKSEGIFSMDDQSECKSWCESGYKSCKAHDEFWWKTYTCMGICKGVRYQNEEGFLPIRSSSNDKCKKECIDNFFR